jgi:hypothetical protein
MRTVDVVRGTSNSAVYNKAVKLHRANQRRVNCGLCSYHRVENAVRKQRSWKRHRKTQFRRR